MHNNEYPKAYIACLASYNAGMLHGEWVDLDGSEEISDRISEILENSPIEEAEEWAVHDHEYCGRLSEYSETQDLDNIQEAFVGADAKSINWEAFIEFCDHQCYDIEECRLANFEEAFAGSGSTLEDWCWNFLEETGQLSEIPENLRYYFNMEAFARDMDINDVFTIHNHKEVLVFWSALG